MSSIERLQRAYTLMLRVVTEWADTYSCMHIILDRPQGWITSRYESDTVDLASRARQSKASGMYWRIGKCSECSSVTQKSSTNDDPYMSMVVCCWWQKTQSLPRVQILICIGEALEVDLKYNPESIISPADSIHSNLTTISNKPVSCFAIQKRGKELLWFTYRIVLCCTGFALQSKSGNLLRKSYRDSWWHFRWVRASEFHKLGAQPTSKTRRGRLYLRNNSLIFDTFVVHKHLRNKWIVELLLLIWTSDHQVYHACCKYETELMTLS